MAHLLTWMLLLTHWGRVTHICVSKQTILGTDNGLSPGRRQAIIWTSAGKLLIGPLGTNFSEILIGIKTFSFKKVHLKMPSAKWRPFCLGLNVLMLGVYGSFSTYSILNMKLVLTDIFLFPTQVTTIVVLDWQIMYNDDVKTWKWLSYHPWIHFTKGQ